MKVLNYSKTREKLASVIDDVVDNNETVIITKNKKSAVVISLDEYNSWKETEYLMGSPNNARRLLKSIEDVSAGKVNSRDLIDNE